MCIEFVVIISQRITVNLPTDFMLLQITCPLKQRYMMKLTVHAKHLHSRFLLTNGICVRFKVEVFGDMYMIS